MELISNDFAVAQLQLIDSKQLAALAGIGLQSIRQAASDKTGKRIKLPVITRVGGLVRFRIDHVKQWLDEAAGTGLAHPSLAQARIDCGQTELKRKRGRPRNNAIVSVARGAA